MDVAPNPRLGDAHRREPPPISRWSAPYFTRTVWLGLAELSQLRAALQRLIESCGCDGQPDGSILDALTGDRPDPGKTYSPLRSA